MSGLLKGLDEFLLIIYSAGILKQKKVALCGGIDNCTAVHLWSGS